MSKMTRGVFVRLVSDTFAGLQKLSQGKGTEYAGEQVHENEHANFDRLAADLGLRPEKVLWVYLKKHLDSILTWVNNPHPKGYHPSEPMEGRIDDAILYLLLLKGMLIRNDMVEPRCEPAAFCSDDPHIDMGVAKAITRQPGQWEQPGRWVQPGQWVMDDHGASQPAPIYGKDRGYDPRSL